MKRTLLFAALAAASILAAGAAHAAVFTYHGNLQDAGKPAEGRYDIELTLYSTPSGGSVLAGPLTIYAVPVHDGNFSTDTDFGPLAKAFDQAYVGVKVRSAGAGDFVALDARSSATEASTSCPGSWSLDGNAGNPGGSYFGTADSASFVLKTDAQQVARAYFNVGKALPNWIGGGSLNDGIGADGSFIGGGGSSTDASMANTVGPLSVIGGGRKNQAGVGAASGFAVVGGGVQNIANTDYAVVAGGDNNTASGAHATIGGGSGNNASGDYSIVAGGDGNSASGDLSFAAGFAVTADGLNSAVVGGYRNEASGDYSFAAGMEANALHQGAFVWSDSTPTRVNSSFDSTGNDQFDVRASGGMAINSVPINSDVELTIVGHGVPGPGLDYANVFMRQNGTAAGILASVGQATVGGNDAQFFLDQFNGTNQTRRLSLAANGDVTVTANAFKPGGGSWTATSDRRIKQDISPIHDALDTVLKLRPITFHYTPEYRAMEGGLADKAYAGFIAQEYREVFPEAVVSTDKHVPGTAQNDAPILALDPNPALITAVAAVQELSVQNAELRERLDDLTARLARLEAGAGR